MFLSIIKARSLFNLFLQYIFISHLHVTHFKSYEKERKMLKVQTNFLIFQRARKQPIRFITAPVTKYMVNYVSRHFHTSV